jgi:hypothetical protein
MSSEARSVGSASEQAEPSLLHRYPINRVAGVAGKDLVGRPVVEPLKDRSQFHDLAAATAGTPDFAQLALGGCVADVMVGLWHATPALR